MAEELTEEQIAELMASLEVLEDKIETVLVISVDSVKPVELDQPIGRLSRIDAIQQKEMASTNRRNLAIRVQQVRAALSAVQRGEYGECNRCGEDIAYARLKARPEAPLCLDCQSEIERP
jgi:DnaK suppressor protein